MPLKPEGVGERGVIEGGVRSRTHRAGLEGEAWEVRDEGTEGKVAQGLQGSTQGWGQE